jgi:hypothetical protein
MSSAKIIIIFAALCLTSCGSVQSPQKSAVPKEFSNGEVILATQLLTKIFDQEMAPLSCVPDVDEASLLLRTIHPRMEMIQDDIEAALDNDEEVKKMVETCEQSCTCAYLDDLLREHLVALSKDIKKTLELKKKQKDLNACLNYVKETFCNSELYQSLNTEKADFSFEDTAP